MTDIKEVTFKRDSIRRSRKKDTTDTPTKNPKCRGSGGAYQKNPQLKNLISVSDLLELRKKSYSHLFPLIDTQKYQTKAHVSIYNTDEMLINEEIIPYFGTVTEATAKLLSAQQTAMPGTPLADEVFESASTSSLSCEEVKNASRGSEQSQNVYQGGAGEEADRVPFLDQFHTRCARLMRSEAALNSIMLRRRSTPMVVKETSSMSLPNLPLNVLNPRSIWVGCIIDYMVITRRLNVRLVHNGDFFEDMLHGKLFAKVSLLPGQLQKKRLTVQNMNKHSYKSIYFEKFSGPELHRMEIGVKLMLKRGIFKRAQTLSEWTVPLEEVSLIGEQTAWQLFEWGS